KLIPSALGGGVQERFLETVSRVPFPVDEKVVLFPGKTKPVEAAPARRPWIAAVAAVAVLGGFSALMMGPQKDSTGSIVRKETSIGPVTPGGDKGTVKTSMGSQVRETQDQGVIWDRNGKPMRQVKVIYVDKMKVVGEDGKIVEVERPRVEWLLVPEKID
ncbi:MAG TPA: hypothetical protein VGE67_17450, partial [Haloferula sp.]